ncbi:MAG: hypothetical protein N2043_02190 [Ignavibacterium sp.]|nr:hypothetical protein [Ignavibacterium sp.]
MIDIKTLEEWRLQYKKVYQIRIHEEIFFYRPLTLGEIELINRYFKKEHEIEEVICKLCVIYPENIDFSQYHKAGVPTRICKAILESSQILSSSQPLERLNEYREKMNQLQYQAEATIMTAFPQIRLEEIRRWDVETVMEWLARAEWALQNIHKLDVGFVSPSDEIEEDLEYVDENIELDELDEENEFVKQEDEKEENPLHLLAKQLRLEGKDPMIELAPIILKKPYKNFVPIPFIAGVQAWKRNEVLDRVREQLQYVIRKQQ